MRTGNLKISWSYEPYATYGTGENYDQMINNQRETICILEVDDVEVCSRTVRIRDNHMKTVVTTKQYVNNKGEFVEHTIVREVPVVYNKSEARYYSFRKLMEYCREKGVLNRSQRKALWNEFLLTVKSIANKKQVTVYSINNSSNAEKAQVYSV